MSVQTSIAASMTSAFAGMCEGEPAVTLSRSIQDAAGVGCGIAVAMGTTPERQCKLFAADADSGIILGLVMFDPHRSIANAAASPDYAQNEMVTIVRQGRMWVPVPAAVTTTEATLSWIVTGGNAGKLTATNNAAALARGIRVLKGAGIGGLALVEINLGGY